MIGRAVESLRLRALDAVDAVRDHDPLVPPRRMRGFVGDSDFRATGDEFLQYEDFDVVLQGIACCRERYADHPHFGFQVADMRNGLYRPDAGVHGHRDHATDSAETPEDAVAYEEAWLRGRVEAHGLELAGPVRLGTWSGLPDADTRQFQDVVLARTAGGTRAS